MLCVCLAIMPKLLIIAHVELFPKASMECNPSSLGLLGSNRWMPSGLEQYPSTAGGRVVCG